MTEARLVRRISGSVNSGRASKSSCEHSRMQSPSAPRPQRPPRRLARAWGAGAPSPRGSGLGLRVAWRQVADAAPAALAVDAAKVGHVAAG